MRAPRIRLGCPLSLLVASSASATTRVVRGRSSALCLAIIAAMNFFCIGSARGVTYTFVDLTPLGFDPSARAEAYSVSGGQQVGAWYGATTTANHAHAVLWSGTAASAVDLHPAGFLESRAFSTSDGQQVGWGNHSQGGATTALLWSGSAGSVVNLHSYLSSDYTNSAAVGIAPNGNIVGYAFTTQGVPHAIEWVVPEPGTGLLVIAGLLGFAGWRKQRT